MDRGVGLAYGPDDIPGLRRLGTVQAQWDTPDPAQAAADVRGIALAYERGVVWRWDMPRLHFVGFSDDRYWAAVKIWGLPDFYHRVWDWRAKKEVMPQDVAIFAKGTFDTDPVPFGWDDSQQDVLARGGKECFL